MHNEQLFRIARKQISPNAALRYLEILPVFRRVARVRPPFLQYHYVVRLLRRFRTAEDRARRQLLEFLFAKRAKNPSLVCYNQLHI